MAITAADGSHHLLTQDRQWPLVFSAAAAAAASSGA